MEATPDSVDPKEARQTRRRAPKVAVRQRFVRTADLREAALMALFGLVVFCLPVAWWPAIADVMHRARRGIKPRRMAGVLERFGSIRGSAVAPSAVRAWDSAFQKGVDRRRLYTVAARFTDRWQPNIALSGADGLAAALERGHGVVLWFETFTHSSLIAKRALHQAGYRLHYLSSKYHPGATSAFGQALLNPVYVATELPHLQGRIVLNDANHVACTRRMWTILRGNGVVGVTNTLSSNMHFIEAPFGSSARLSMSSTVPGLALQTGAAVLPVATVETNALQEYSVIVGPELRADPSLGREQAAAEIAAAYARWLLPLVKEYPEQWSGWKGGRILL
jgi:hypothetical protein